MLLKNDLIKYTCINIKNNKNIKIIDRNNKNKDFNYNLINE